MKPVRELLLALGLLCASAMPASAQMTLEQAREEGKNMGNAAKANPDLRPHDHSQAEAVPGYPDTTLPQESYFDDPDQLVNDAQALKNTNEPYNITTDSAHTRPTFSNSEILATTNRGTTIEGNPDTYIAGEDYGGSSGTCTALPPGSGTDGYYEASCNAGAKVEETTPSCHVPLVVTATPGTSKHIYTCENWTRTFAQGGNNAARRCKPAFDTPVSSGVCRERSRRTVIYEVCLQGHTPRLCTEPDVREGEEITYACDSAAVPSRPNKLETVGEVVTETKDEGVCNAATTGKTCELTSETCTDPAPATRIINGVSVTKACWAWDRTYTCNGVTSGNDCGTLAANPACTYVRDECLDDPDENPTGPCKTTEKIYRCPTPSGTSPNANQYICGDDVYCINGDCEPIVREASTEFKDALVALHSIDQAGKEFDETNLTVFRGTRETCHKPVFGLINCCAGKVSGAVPVAAGAAALAGGPFAIAAFATPFLTLFACSQDEMKLDIKDRMGFCHKVGTYCSSSFLGICKTKRTAYCCFESKLSRLLQEQGRVQLGKPWGAPKKEQCIGFTIDEFAQLDLSVMDFTEAYSDFMDAAKLPDEVETMTDIQQKIQDSYDLHSQ